MDIPAVTHTLSLFSLTLSLSLSLSLSLALCMSLFLSRSLCLYLFLYLSLTLSLPFLFSLHFVFYLIVLSHFLKHCLYVQWRRLQFPFLYFFPRTCAPVLISIYPSIAI